MIFPVTNYCNTNTITDRNQQITVEIKRTGSTDQDRSKSRCLLNPNNLQQQIPDLKRNMQQYRYQTAKHIVLSNQT